jgi:hypothetical protein
MAIQLQPIKDLQYNRTLTFHVGEGIDAKHDLRSFQNLIINWKKVHLQSQLVGEAEAPYHRTQESVQARPELLEAYLHQLTTLPLVLEASSND